MTKMLFGVLQGSILGPISLNIFLSDLSLIVEGADINSYADDSAICGTGEGIGDLISSSQEFFKKVSFW